MGFYSVPQGNPDGVINYDEKRAMEQNTSRLSHRKSERKVDIGRRKGRDDSLYEQSDRKCNIRLENTKEERAEEIRNKRE